jgi:hypothetical protein
MGRIARLEKEVASLKEALANLKFTSDAEEIVVQVPVETLDANNAPTGSYTTGYRTIKAGPRSGTVHLQQDSAILRVL